MLNQRRKSRNNRGVSFESDPLLPQLSSQDSDNNNKTTIETNTSSSLRSFDDDVSDHHNKNKNDNNDNNNEEDATKSSLNDRWMKDDTTTTTNNNNNNNNNDNNNDDEKLLITGSEIAALSSSQRLRQIAQIFKRKSQFIMAPTQQEQEQQQNMISLNDRDRALRHEGIGEAAFLIQEAVLGEIENPSKGAYDPYIDSSKNKLFQNNISIICRRISSAPIIVQLLHGTAWMILLLTFIEPPQWCRDDNQKYYNYQYRYAPHLQQQGCHAFLEAKGNPISITSSSSLSEQQQQQQQQYNNNIISWHNTTMLNDDDDDGNNNSNDNNNNDVQYYPNSRSMILSVEQSAMIEAIGLAIIFILLLIRLGRDGFSIRIYMRPGSSRWNRIVQIVSITIMVMTLIIKNQFLLLLQPYFRLSLLLSFLIGVQRDVRVVMQVLPRVIDVLGLLAVLIFFYSWFGCVMFVGSKEGQKYFPNIFDGAWTLWISITTANYPDALMPALNENRWTALFGISFMIITFFFLTNIILASVVDQYNNTCEKRTSERLGATNEKLKKAFALMDTQNTGRINRETVMGLFFILNEDFPEFRTLSNSETNLLFAVLDKDGTSMISEEEFMDFGNVLLLEFTKASDYTPFIEQKCPHFAASKGYRTFCRMVKSKGFEIATDIILVLNALVIGIQSFPELSDETVSIDPKFWDGSIDTIWELVEAIFTGIYAMEAMAKILVLGRRRYFESTKNIFDFTITVMAVVSTIIVYYPNDFNDSRIIRMIVMCRVLRLARLLTAMKRFQTIGAISEEILPAARTIITLLFLLMYLFAAIGMTLYGGLITRDPENELSHALLGTDYAESEYWANNFNDMISSMIVLFNLLVVNNWTVFASGLEATTSSSIWWVRLFFFLFHVLGVIVVNNLVIALIINEFLTHLAIFKENVDHAEFVHDDSGGNEALLYHRQAVFDSSTVTGTKTNLSGTYIARIGRSDLEGRDHERLRKLFTQTSSVRSAEEGQ